MSFTTGPLSLAGAWAGVAAHLWQTSLVLALLLLLSPALRYAPARIADRFWSIGLVKLFLPLALFQPIALSARDHLLGGSAALARRMPGVEALLDPAPLGGVGDGTLISGRLFVAITAAWAAVAIFLAVRSIGRRGPVGAPVFPADRLPGEERKKIARLCRAALVPISSLRFTSEPIVPAVTGLFRPVILLSRSMIGRLDPGDLLVVLLHENEHRRRREPLRSLVARAAATLFFFYPPTLAASPKDPGERGVRL